MGSFFSDPVRAVVVDENGHLHAQSALGSKMHLACSKKAEEPHCFVYDSIENRIHQVDIATLEIGRQIEIDGRPTNEADPSFMGNGFGFTSRNAMHFEIAGLEAKRVLFAPFPAGLTTLWWFITALFLTPTLWKLYGTKGNLCSWSWMSLTLSALGLLVFAALIVVSVFWFAVGYYSLYFAAYCGLLGLLLAFYVTKSLRHGRP